MRIKILGKQGKERNIIIYRLNTVAINIFFLMLLCSSSVFSGEKEAFKFGTGPSTGVYNQFAQDLIHHLNSYESNEVRLVNITTEGSVDNITRLKAKNLDLAIIQNDIGSYAYYGKHGHKRNREFLAGMPLFTEFVQIVVLRDGEIRLLGDLDRKVISVGPKNSGSYWNALDLLTNLNLRTGLDYQLVYSDATRSINSVLNGKADAAIFTRASLPPAYIDASKKLQLLPIPKEISQNLAARKPYYHFQETTIDTIDGKQTIPTLSVTSYLAIGRHVSNEDAEKIIKVIVKAWPVLRQSASSYNLVNLKQSKYREPFPYHAGAEKALTKLGLMTRPVSKYYIIPGLLMLFWLVRKARKTCDIYDCLGNIGPTRNSFIYKAVNLVASSGTYLYALIAFSLIVVSLVLIIQYFDIIYAQELNIDSPFSEIAFGEALLWMFLFISSGRSGDIFPISPAGQVVAGIMPIIGLMTIFGFLYLFIERKRKLRLERMRGVLVKDVSDHVLICGWNEKVPGLIYGLTSNDAPRRRQVVVIAELDEDAPLSEYAFDHNYVSYCRGDSADLTTLRKAHAEKASDAIVVAGVKKQTSKNLRSILSILSLRSRFSDVSDKEKRDKSALFISAEMTYSENRDLFISCGADAVVQSDIIMNRLISSSCFSDYIPDFLLDILTHDDYSEIYSAKVGYLDQTTRRFFLKDFCLKPKYMGQALKFLQALSRKKETLSGRPAGYVHERLMSGGINLVGIIKHGEGNQCKLLDQKFDDSSFNLLLSSADKDYMLDSEDSILFLADDYVDIVEKIFHRKSADETTEQLSSIDWDFEEIKSRKILIVGDLERADELRNMLQTSGAVVQIVTNTSKYNDDKDSCVVIENPLKKETWQQIKPWSFDVIVILSDDKVTKNSVSVVQDHGDMDAIVIMTARIIRYVSDVHQGKDGKKVRIVSEMVNYRCRHLFEDAGVDVIVPRTILVERILTKLVFHHGEVCNFMAAMLAIEDGIFFRVLKVKETDACCGMELNNVFRVHSKNTKVWGYLPKEGREILRNNRGDFEYHFITNPSGISGKEHILSGDMLVLAVKMDIQQDISD